VPRNTTLDLEELRRIWLQRPEASSRRVDGPQEPQPDGTIIQYGYTDATPLPTTPLPRLACFPLRIRFHEVVRQQLGPVKSFPMRSLPLLEFVEGFLQYLDWKVKENVIAKRLPVHPEWQEWFDSVQDPRKENDS
jgi:hypothetical protein